MITLVMIMGCIRCQRVLQSLFPKEDQPREALLFDGSHPALYIGVQIRRPYRQRHPRHPSGVDNVLKGWAVFPVSVMNEVLPGSQEAPPLHRDVARHLHHPLLVGMRCHTGHMDPPTAQVDKKQHVVCHEPTQGPDLGGEEVGRDQHVHVRADKLLPRGRRLAFWSRGMLWRFRMLPTVWSLIVYPRLAKAP